MSEVAGRLAPQMGAWTLQKANGGSGVLLGGVPGVRPANVVIIGGGVVGTAAARVAVGMGANVTVLDRSVPRLSYLDDIFMGRLTTQYASAAELPRCCPAPTWSSARCWSRAPPRRSCSARAIGEAMKPGSVLVDVAIDQGGCFETSRATTTCRSDLRRWTGSCITASPTCPARWPAPRRRRLAMRPALHAGAGRQGLAAVSP